MGISGSDKRDLIMPDENGELTLVELRNRWETPEGQAFRAKIIRQLKSEEAVDWKNLEVEINGEPNKWVEFDGVEEIKEKNKSLADLRGIKLSFEKLENTDLSEARLEGAYLNGARLEDADLSEARLEGTNLIGANLEGAVLSRARLEGANLTEANLEDADLLNANLEGSNLTSARLEGAYFQFALLEGADFSYSNLNGADLHNAKFYLKTWGMKIEELNSYKKLKSYLEVVFIPITLVLSPVFIMNIF